MRNFRAIFRREFGVYFVSPTAYIILTALLLVAGGYFYLDLKTQVQGRVPLTYAPTLYVVVWLVVMVCPLITMRLLAEEKNKGTLEVLMTSPVTELQVVLAKYASAIVFLSFLLLPTLGYIILISRYGDVDWRAVMTGYGGVLLAGACIFSIGIFVSSLCQSQVTAGIVTLLISFCLLLMMFFADRVPADSIWKGLFLQFYLIGAIQDLLFGVVDSRPLIYCASLIVLFLFMTLRVLESRRWR